MDFIRSVLLFICRMVSVVTVLRFNRSREFSRTSRAMERIDVYFLLPRVKGQILAFKMKQYNIPAIIGREIHFSL